MIVAAGLLTGWNLWQQTGAGIKAGDTLALLIPAIEENSGAANAKSTADEASGLDTEAEAQPAQTDEDFADTETVPDYVINPNMDMPSVKVNDEKYIGVLTIPDLDLELPVMKEWSYPNLKKAPCRYTGTAYKDNLIICAHNYNTHFGRLKNLKQGARISLVDTDGNVFSYQVTETEILKPNDIWEMKNGEWDLTLFTCTIGGATRVTVRCQRLDEEEYTMNLQLG